MNKFGTVLCVDDEPKILRSLQWLLNKKFEVATAASGQDGLSLVKYNDFDVVISDQRMPGMTGVEFLREVRQISPRSMRLLLTGYSDKQAVLRSVNESEVYRFIKKPWEISTLVEITLRACRIAQSARRGEKAAPGIAAQKIRESILLLDDDPAVIQELATAVDSNTSIMHTENLAEAVAILAEQEVGILVSNTRVQNRDVTGLLMLLKQNIPDLVSVVLSDKTDVETVIQLINQSQVYRFIPKPIRPGYMKMILDSAINKHRQLVSTPEFTARHSVEALNVELKNRLLFEIKNMAYSPATETTKVGQGGDSSQFFDRVTAGLKRIFAAG